MKNNLKLILMFISLLFIIACQNTGDKVLNKKWYLYKTETGISDNKKIIIHDPPILFEFKDKYAFLHYKKKEFAPVKIDGESIYLTTTKLGNFANGKLKISKNPKSIMVLTGTEIGGDVFKDYKSFWFSYTNHSDVILKLQKNK